MGKLSAKELQKMLDCIRGDSRVLVPPMIGFDAGVHRLGNKCVVVASDPCTGVPEKWFGWLLVNYAASDVALFGAKPEFCTINLLGPRPTHVSRFQAIMEQTCSAADELGIAIVRGHTGMYDSIRDVVGVCTVYGTVRAEGLITPGGSQAGDLVLCTKPLGLETLTNYSLTHPKTAQKLFGFQRQRELAAQVHMQSCVKEAQALAQVHGVHAMHDATEGGFTAALNELADASKVGFIVKWDKLPLCREARSLQSYFSLSDEQLLAMSSTGTILAAVNPQAKDKVEAALNKRGLNAYSIGEFTQKPRRQLIRQGKQTVFPKAADDPYTLLLSCK